MVSLVWTGFDPRICITEDEAHGCLSLEPPSGFIFASTGLHYLDVYWGDGELHESRADAVEFARRDIADGIIPCDHDDCDVCREPRSYEVYQRDSDYFVRGLSSCFDGKGDEMLLAVYPEGDCDRPYTAELMHSALYDVYQQHDGLHDGDRFETEFGAFVCDGVHVVPAKQVKVTKLTERQLDHVDDYLSCSETSVHRHIRQLAVKATMTATTVTMDISLAADFIDWLQLSRPDVMTLAAGGAAQTEQQIRFAEQAAARSIDALVAKVRKAIVE